MPLTTMLNSCMQETFDWPRLYKRNPKSSHTYYMLLEGQQVPSFHLQDALLCHMGHLSVPSSECENMIWETHYSQVDGHFGVKKIVEVVHNYFYWLNL